ncbi:MAG TPA: hypothetical protein V6D29_13910 [Leptolyngbyaceae cyanobacterium]
MDRIKDQSNRVSQLVFAPETGATYKKTLTLTWDILRETGLLVWLVICLVFVGTDWFWNNSIRLGRNARAWYDGLGEKSESSEQSLAEKSQSLLEVGKSGAAYLLAQARQQLGMPQPQPDVAVTPAAPKVAAAPAPTPVPASTSVPIPKPIGEAPSSTVPTVVDTPVEDE